MKSPYLIDNYKGRIKKVFYEIRDNVLDEFNESNITKDELISILDWCLKVEDILLEECDASKETDL